MVAFFLVNKTNINKAKSFLPKLPCWPVIYLFHFSLLVSHRHSCKSIASLITYEEPCHFLDDMKAMSSTSPCKISEQGQHLMPVDIPITSCLHHYNYVLENQMHIPNP